MNNEKTLKLLVNIGQDALDGKICNQCGRKFRKTTGKIRLCSKCKENQ